MTLRLSRDDVRGLLKAGRIAPADLPPDVRLMEHRGRTRSGKCADLGGLYVRSSWEANYARWLNVMQAHGFVVAWEYEPKVFVFRGIARGCREYRPDFEVLQHDTALSGTYQHFYVEIKGYMDAKSKTRLKRMAKYYPGVRVDVIGREWFVDMERSGLAGAIPGWERL